MTEIESASNQNLDDNSNVVAAENARHADLEKVSRAIERNTVNLSRRRMFRVYLVLPVVFLTVALLGGLRISAVDSAVIFIKPSLFTLLAACVLMVLFFRSGLINFAKWFSDDFSLTTNAANAAVLLSVFAASTQLFNSLLPEAGLPLWIVGFCFVWTLWNNLFADFDAVKMLRSLGALFGLAFVAKYILLAGLTVRDGGTWLQRLIDNPVREPLTRLLDLPGFSGGTGYIQFFALLLYILGLYLMPRMPPE